MLTIAQLGTFVPAPLHGPAHARHRWPSITRASWRHELRDHYKMQKDGSSYTEKFVRVKVLTRPPASMPLISTTGAAAAAPRERRKPTGKECGLRKILRRWYDRTLSGLWVEQGSRAAVFRGFE